MIEVPVELGSRSYPVVIGEGALDTLGGQVRAVAPHDRALLAVDSAIVRDHGAVAQRSLEEAGYEVVRAEVTATERSKSLAAVDALYDVMLGERLERGSPVVAVGGGITGDVAGFAAATYLRGVPFVQVPTTLLAAVDASVGGKTGVNHALPDGALGKNLIGAFWQPRLVLTDPNVLATLDPRDFRCGLAECIKHGMIGDRDHLAWIESHLPRILSLDGTTLTALIESSVRIKAGVVAADEREAGRRAVLNLGHTFGHAIEPRPELDLRHGEAVSIGLVAALAASVELGRLSGEEAARVAYLLDTAGLPIRLPAPVPVAALLEAMQFDKKIRDGRLRLVLPRGLGDAEVMDDVRPDIVELAWMAVGSTR